MWTVLFNKAVFERLFESAPNCSFIANEELQVAVNFSNR